MSNISFKVLKGSDVKIGKDRTEITSKMVERWQAYMSQVENELPLTRDWPWGRADTSRLVDSFSATCPSWWTHQWERVAELSPSLMKVSPHQLPPSQQAVGDSRLFSHCLLGRKGSWSPGSIPAWCSTTLCPCQGLVSPELHSRPKFVFLKEPKDCHLE